MPLVAAEVLEMNGKFKKITFHRNLISPQLWNIQYNKGTSVAHCCMLLVFT